MPLRSPEAILCAHCAALRGASDCAGCGLVICDGCAARSDRCPRPLGVELRLGAGARLRSVDPTCRWALASTWRGELFRIDLQGLVAGAPQKHFDDVTVTSDGGFDKREGTLDRDGRTELIIDDRRVAILDLQLGGPASIKPLRKILVPFSRSTVSAAASDSTHVACASFGAVGVWRLADSARLQRIEIDGHDVTWVGIAGYTLAALVASGIGKSRNALVVWSWADGRELAWLRLGDVREPLADLCADGSRVAAADDRSNVLVFDRDGPMVQLGGHSDGLSALRISSDGGRLVSGDFDNRVIIRDRGVDGFAPNVRAAELRRP